MADLPSHIAGTTVTEPVPLIDLVAQYETISEPVMQAVQEVFTNQSFVLGQTVAEFEEQIAEYCDAREAIGCASGTDALVLSLMALNVGSGDEVITTPFTFFATAGAIHRVGAKPVFVDIDPVSFNMNTDHVERAITANTKAIMPVHLFGQCADMEPLWRIGARNGIPIIEDACQAIGSEYRGRRAGALGTVGCFSFFPTKNLGGAGDGGIITTDDRELAARLRRLRVHGDTGGYSHMEVGLNSRLDALQAAVLGVKLKSLDSWSESRQANARRYNELFRQHNLLDVIESPTALPDSRHIYNQYTVRIRGGQRDVVLSSLREQQIGCGIYYPTPLHLQECFQHLGYQPGDLPESESAAQEVLSLPVFAELTTEQQNRVVEGLANAFGRGVGSTMRRKAA